MYNYQSMYCMTIIYYLLFNYNLVMYKRVVNKETNFGNMYFENTYNKTNIHTNTNVTWLTK